MDQEQEVTNKLSEEQLKRMLSDLREEIVRVEMIKKTAEFRARRYDELTSRVKFLRKSQEKVERSLRRLYTANRLVDRCVSALNQLSAQVDQYAQQLEAA